MKTVYNIFRISEKKNIQISLLVILIVLVSACNSKQKKATVSEPVEEEKTQVVKENPWIWLFDGSSTDGWRAFNGEVLPKSWVIEENTLKSLGNGGDIGGDIVYSTKEFENFELSLEWKIAEGGNSGIFYHVKEGKEYKAPYECSPEYQVIDQLGFPHELEPWQSIAADYGMHVADTTKLIVKKAEEWNTTRIVFTPQKVEHWLNGNKVVEFVPWTPEWTDKKENGKWKDYPNYGLAKKGFIGLQDHGSFVWYKNIKVREL